MTPHVVVARGGEVVLLSAAVRSVLHLVLTDAVRTQGYSSPVVRDLIGALVEGERRTQCSAAEHDGIPQVAELAVSESDLINTTEAGELLHTTSRAVRGLCERGRFETASKASGSWRIARSEVVARAEGEAA